MHINKMKLEWLQEMYEGKYFERSLGTYEGAAYSIHSEGTICIKINKVYKKNRIIYFNYFYIEITGDIFMKGSPLKLAPEMSDGKIIVREDEDTLEDIFGTCCELSEFNEITQEKFNDFLSNMNEIINYRIEVERDKLKIIDNFRN
jgi:hypothetical protein